MFKRILICLAAISAISIPVHAQEVSRDPVIYGKHPNIKANFNQTPYWANKWETAISKPITVSGKWDNVIQEAKNLPKREKLNLINIWVNKNLHFKSDGPTDKWDSADKALKRGYGDCEEYVVIKYQMLIAAGYPETELYVTVGRNYDGGHAVLIADLDGEFRKLENNDDILEITHPTIYNFKPVIAMNDNGAWIWKR